MKPTQSRPHYSIDERKRWMDILARCSAEQLGAYYRQLDPKPRYRLVDRTEPTPRASDRFSMAEGRGVSENVTRCVVRLSSGVTGMACLPGRKRRHAEIAAVFDALLKEPERYDELIGTVIESMKYDVMHARTVATAVAETGRHA